MKLGLSENEISLMLCLQLGALFPAGTFGAGRLLGLGLIEEDPGKNRLRLTAQGKVWLASEGHMPGAESSV
jgi:hypothetical protein